jgi:hypothetical protein
MSHEKISDADIENVLRSGAQLIQELLSENVEMRTKLASVQAYARADQIMEEAERKGLDLSPLVGGITGRHEKVAALLEKNANLDVLEQAVQVSVGDLGFGQLGGEQGSGGGGSAADQFAAALLDINT